MPATVVLPRQSVFTGTHRRKQGFWSRILLPTCHVLAATSALGSGQDHISMHNTYSTTSVPDHATLASSNREIRLFESPVRRLL